MSPPPQKNKFLKQDKKWLELGVDIGLIRNNLKLSFEERISQHQNTLQFIEELRQIGLNAHAKPPSPSQTTDR